MLTWTEIETRAIAFQNTWKNAKGDERQEAQTFEKDFMNIFGVDFKDGFHEYQLTLKDGNFGYIDYFLPGKILIEMKSKGKSLAKAYTQAMDYIHVLKADEKPEILMVCDFDKIEVYNLVKDIKYKSFKVSQLKKHIRIFGILAGYKDKFEEKNEIELNKNASYKMSDLHNQLKEYGYEEKYLETYLVRLLFCLFADDTGIFEKDSFEEYIKESREDGSDLSMRIMQLFEILDTPIEKRMKNTPLELNRFRYINGSLFKEKLPSAIFDEKMRKLLIECCNFDWSKISPTIFGAMFQGIMDQKQRREIGAHYTSEENILKVIKPLFLDELYKEFEKSKSTKKELEEFHNKIANLKFLDPACGSGNFLILTYQKLRELEFEILKYLNSTRQLSLFDIFSKVHINQFYGIEYEPFATEVAKISLLLMKHLMDRKVSNYFGQNIIDFPIKENANILNGNALNLEWEDVDYIMGNPPFIGKKYMSKEQKEDILNIFPKKTKTGILDYITCWFYKASLKAKENINLKIAFVSTNSICQGEQVSILWKPILEENNCKIDFAYRSFKWSNEAKGNAGVTCIIVGLSNKNKITLNKRLFLENGDEKIVENINPYLMGAENIFIERRTEHIQQLLKMSDGNVPIDNNYLKLEQEEYEEFKIKEPQTLKYIKKLVGSDNFISKKPRYVLWLVDVSLSELRNMPMTSERVKKVRDFRLESKRAATLKLADTPTSFEDTRNPKTALIIPRVSSEKRKYIPMGIIDEDTIALNAVVMLENASLLEFSILTSDVHMAWMRTFAGRLKTDYRYSVSIVYNNFPFPDIDEKMKEKLVVSAQKILDVREKYKNDSFADLYDDTFMPIDLRKAHQENDKAVWEAYGKKWEFGNEEQCVAYLMKLYKEITIK